MRRYPFMRRGTREFGQLRDMTSTDIESVPFDFDAFLDQMAQNGHNGDRDDVFELIEGEYQQLIAVGSSG